MNSWNLPLTFALLGTKITTSVPCQSFRMPIRRNWTTVRESSSVKVRSQQLSSLGVMKNCQLRVAIEEITVAARAIG